METDERKKTPKKRSGEQSEGLSSKRIKAVPATAEPTSASGVAPVTNHPPIDPSVESSQPEISNDGFKLSQVAIGNEATESFLPSASRMSAVITP